MDILVVSFLVSGFVCFCLFACFEGGQFPLEYLSSESDTRKTTH